MDNDVGKQRMLKYPDIDISNNALPLCQPYVREVVLLEQPTILNLCSVPVRITRAVLWWTMLLLLMSSVEHLLEELKLCVGS